MEECLFCKIVKKEVPVEFVYEDSDVVVFRDINPKARVHLLIVPAPHIESFLAIDSKQLSSLTKMTKVVQRLIEGQKLEESYQLIFNGGRRQHVPHLHWHLLGD